MKTSLLAGAALLIAAALPAAAADLAAPFPVKAAPAPAFSWTGFHLGGHGGYGWSERIGGFREAIVDTITYGVEAPLTFEPDGWFGGIQGGFDYQFANGVVLGVEADVAFGSFEQSAHYDGYTNESDIAGDLRVKLDSFGTLRGRLGYAFDRVLPYVTGGLAWAQVDVSNEGAIDYLHGGGEVPFADGGSDTLFGWTLGGGVEWAFVDRWSVKAEYLYTDLGSEQASLLDTDADYDVRIQTVKLGINFRF